ncbi:MAG: peptidylprolyl isomerase [Myxococcota bacterium]
MFRLLSFAFLVACQPQTGTSAVPGELPSTGAAIMTVNGVNVTQATVDAILAQFPAGQKEEFLAQGGMDRIKEQLSLTEALYQEAIKANVHTDPDIKVTIALAVREAMVQALIAKQAETRVTDDKIKTWYEDHLVQFRKSEVDLAMIVVQSEEEANAALEEINGGKAFADVAKEKSIDPQAKTTGGDMGKMESSALPPQLRMQVDNTEAGNIAGPVNMGGAFALIQVKSKSENVQALEDVKEDIRENVKREEAQSYVEEIKTAAQIVDLSAAKIEAPAADAPAAEAPAADAPAAEAPAADAPAADAPADEAPAADAPAADAPAAQ